MPATQGRNIPIRYSVHGNGSQQAAPCAITGNAMSADGTGVAARHLWKLARLGWSARCGEPTDGTSKEKQHAEAHTWKQQPGSVGARARLHGHEHELWPAGKEAGND